MTYRAAIDGRWILMEYDAKNALLTHRFDNSTGPGPHKLRLVVADNRGNEAVLEGDFVR
jgi:hypothetical protein